MGENLEKITIRDMRNSRANLDLDTDSIVIYSLGCQRYEFHLNKNGEFEMYRTWRECE